MNIYIIIGILITIGVVLGIVFSNLGKKQSLKSKYQYKKKNFFMTRAEHECFNILNSAFGNQYFIFPQAHLDTFIDHKVINQNWKGAHSHINQKSVDFVFCDKEFISPKLVIELDDKSHERPNRVTRDEIVKDILDEAGIPLVRIENHGNFKQPDLVEQIQKFLQ